MVGQVVELSSRATQTCYPHGDCLPKRPFMLSGHEFLGLGYGYGRHSFLSKRRILRVVIVAFINEHIDVHEHSGDSPALVVQPSALCM